jgi:hypothetical protein
MKCNHKPKKQPEGYIAWHEWADKMSKTHRQEKCPCCGLWKIWVKKDLNEKE